MDDAASRLQAIRDALLEGRAAEALQLGLRERDQRPNDPAVHELLSDCYDALGDEAMSLHHAATAWELSPSNERTAQSLVSEAADSMREHDILSVRRLCKRAVQLDPENADAYALLAEVQNIFERWEDARKAANTALRLSPGHKLALTQRAVALRMLGEGRVEQDTIDAALVEDENDARVQYWAGETALYKGENERALRHFVRAQELDPSFEVARIGQCEALKAVNPLYRLTVRAVLTYRRSGRKGRLTATASLLILAGAYWLVPDELATVAFVVACAACVLGTLGLVRTNLGDFFLQFSSAGRAALPRRFRVAANATAALLCGVVAQAVGYAVLDGFGQVIAAFNGVLLLMLIFPLCAAVKSPRDFWWFSYSIAIATWGMVLATMLYFVFGTSFDTYKTLHWICVGLSALSSLFRMDAMQFHARR